MKECELCGDGESICVDGVYLCPSCADLVEQEELLEEDEENDQYKIR